MAERERKLAITTLQIPSEERKRLEQLAFALGYVQPRGPGAGKLGNISALVRAIAQGRIRLVPAHDGKPGQEAAPADQE